MCDSPMHALLPSLTSPVPGFVQKGVESLSESTGQDVETLEYLLGMLICYPLGLIMLSLPNGKVKHLFSFILGAFFCSLRLAFSGSTS